MKEWRNSIGGEGTGSAKMLKSLVCLRKSEKASVAGVTGQGGVADKAREERTKWVRSKRSD